MRELLRRHLLLEEVVAWSVVAVTVAVTVSVTVAVAVVVAVD